ncbi:MAG: lytic murein transglycosylase B [Gammaproteobacteria bacterium]|nr:lytic murein transglycosylase B [Gammaproteobacteria bacterium]
MGRITRAKLFVLSHILGLAALSCSVQAAETAKLSDRPDVQAFIQTMVQEDNFDAKYLKHLFDQVALQPTSIASISQPAEIKDWTFYENLFITDKRVSDGYKFWQKHYKVLDNLQKKYGVPPSIIVSILGVETFYGEKQGEYRVMDALTTLAFEYPPRQSFFRKELAEYLRLIRDYNLAPLALKGSYAGAIGKPQFMPSSYRHYAVTYEGTHDINLQKNDDDILASVANYFKENGWRRNEPILAPVVIARKSALTGITPNVAPTQNIRQLYDAGLQVKGNYDPTLKANLVLLATPEQPLYYLGFNNFYTIMRYNISVNYAMAVYTLSNILDQCWQQKAKSCSIAES